MIVGVMTRVKQVTVTAKQPHVDVERVDSVDLESTGPPTRWPVHHPNTQKIVKINSRPVIGQNTVGQR